ncbi:MAG: NTP transferase domain-containing protein [Proteobacteria bacterium]|nr:NTP transferase domain-containing protein [Pseudomonadota bacterium]MBU4447846.1 NTP transferase domain-containing protein [Pseudomonadota bacterium]
MRAIILAGGKGVRLAPLTDVIPKPLVPIGGMPVLEIVIRQLKANGFHHITLAVGYLADLIKAYFQDGARWGVKIDYSFEAQPLGTAGPLGLINGLNETFLVMNADILTDFDYNFLIGYHREQGCVATIGAFERQVRIDLGVIVTDGHHRIKDYIEKPTQSYLVSMGVYIFEPKVLEFLPDKGYMDFPDLVKRLLEADLPVGFRPFSGYWLDIGRHEDYYKAAEEFEQLREKLGV